MKVLSVVSQKGGVGKTTLSAHLAVQAQLTGAGPIGMLDADPQESLLDWWSDRVADTPLVVPTSLWRLEDDIRHMAEIGTELLVVDTPPGVVETIRNAVELSDLVLVPAKPSPHDLRATGRTIGLLEGLGKPVVFAINCASAWARITSQAVVALSQHGTVAPVVVHQRADFAASMIDGRSVMEVGRKSRSVAEIAALWDYLDARLKGDLSRTSLRPMQDVA